MKASLIQKREVLVRGQTKEGSIKGSLLWKSAENIEMINSNDRVLLTNPEINLLNYHLNLEHIYGCMKHKKHKQ